MSDWMTTATLALGFIAILYLGRQTFQDRTGYPLPPGPPGLPWVGNVIGISTSAPWKTYAEWAKTYGDIVYTRLFGRDIIVINSEKIAKDLLENRARNYSDRPRANIVEMCGLGFNTVFLPYGDEWRLHRRLFHQTFRLDAAQRFLPLQHHRACYFLRQLLDNPELLDGHVFEYAASIILNSVYNYDLVSRKDELVEIASHLVETVAPAARPDIDVIVGVFPSLLRLPSWLPGMSFKKKMERAKTFAKHYLERLLECSLHKMSTHGIAPSMVCDTIQGMEEKEISSKELWMTALKEACGTAFPVATETTHSVVMTFFLMMVLNPGAQEKAQAQIDEVVGNIRLPTMDDRPLLPFLDAIFRETIRTSPVGPLSVPHAAKDEDVYGGFRIPKGAIILANAWSMAHDETRFPNPDAFIPERFLNDDGSLKPNETEHIGFGFGRRICVGRYFADPSVWAIIAKVLAVFKILKPLDANGMEMPVEARFGGGLGVAPLPFGFRIVPRFPEMDAEKLEQLIAASTP